MQQKSEQETEAGAGRHIVSIAIERDHGHHAGLDLSDRHPNPPPVNDVFDVAYAEEHQA